jgi:hypothetical protein
MSRGFAMVVVFAATCLSAAGCRQPPAAAMTAVSSEAKPYFLHHVVDDQPPGGAECCTDVAAVADVDGDGYLDVVIGGEHDRSAGLVWYDYPTWTRHDVGRGEFTTDGEALDFDDDGDADIVVGDSMSGVVWFENLGAGSSWRRHVVGTGYAHDIEVADFDGDGRNDILICDKKVVELWQQLPDGRFARQQLSSEAGEGLAVADLDSDGDPDVFYSNHWIENRRLPEGVNWLQHPLAPEWPVDTRIQVADLDGNGHLDVVLSASEGDGRISWFEFDKTDVSVPWKEHPVTVQTFTGAHSLRVADFDLDGHPDIAVAEMHTSPLGRIMVFFQDRESWRGVLLATHGSHNVVASDMDGDGDIDLVGKNYAGEGRVVEFWENRAADLRLVPLLGAGDAGRLAWQYLPLDENRPDFDRQKFGLLLADVNDDGDDDVVAGSTMYLNPSDPQVARWPRVSFGGQQDAIHVTRQVLNGWHAILAADGEGVSLASRMAGADDQWTSRSLHRLPPGRTQGFAAGPLRANGSYEVYFTRDTALFRLEIPSDLQGEYPLELISNELDEAGVASADLDADGDLDLVAVARGGRQLIWFEAVSDGGFQLHYIGAGLRWFDRVAIADVNGDGRSDVVYTEESGDWDYNARVGWLAAPADPSVGHWQNHTVAVLRSINSLAANDVDGDGRVDLVVGEHTDMRGSRVADDTFTGIFLNRSDDHWDVDAIDISGRSNHMGMLATRLDPGYVDVLSVGWEQYCCVHRWRRPAAMDNEGFPTITSKGDGE